MRLFSFTKTVFYCLCSLQQLVCIICWPWRLQCNYICNWLSNLMLFLVVLFFLIFIFLSCILLMKFSSNCGIAVLLEELSEVARLHHKQRKLPLLQGANYCSYMLRKVFFPALFPPLLDNLLIWFGGNYYFLNWLFWFNFLYYIGIASQIMTWPYLILLIGFFFFALKSD